MNRQRKSLCLSLLIHGLLLSSLYAVSSSSAWQSAPLVIDFDVSSGAGPAGAPEPVPAGPARPARPAARSNPAPRPRAVTPLPPAPVAPQAPPRTALEQNGPAAIVAPQKREAVAAARVEGPTSATVPAGPSLSSDRGGGGASGGGSVSGGSGSGTGGGGGGATADQLRNRYLKEHFTYIRDLIQKSISYPARARKFGWAGKVVVTFIVHESGRVSNERVIASSGYELLDNNVIGTIREVSPFPKPPVKAELRIPIVYSLE